MMQSIHEDYQFMDQFVVYELQPALSKDASISVHPMTNPVQTPEEIAGIFDYVTYGKCTYHMISQILLSGEICSI